MTALTCDLVFATSNAGKLEEVRAMLEGLPLVVRGIRDVVSAPPAVVEDGETFEANAKKKALALSSATRMLTLADDSGLEVDVLGGRPGVRSARFAGEGATDADNNAALLRELEEFFILHPERRGHPITARFRCVLAIVDPYADGGAPLTVDGTCEGTISLNPRGSGGFGYDPLFVVEGSGKTMAELSEAEKNSVSHRGRAIAKLRPTLERILVARFEDIRRVTGQA